MRSHRGRVVLRDNSVRVLAAIALVFAAGAVCTPAYAESPPPTALVPQAPPTESGGIYATLGFGVPDETERLQGHDPILAFSLGGSIAMKPWAYVDVGMYFSTASYDAEPSLSGWGDDADVRTFAITASGRFGYTGKKAAIFGSAGVGFAYVTLGADQFYGVNSSPVGKTVVPVLTVAGSFEAPARKYSRFLAELRYSWINADFGSNSGGSLNAGGPALLLGWKLVF